MKLDSSILKEMISKQLNTLLESSDDGDVYSHGIGGGRAVATKALYPPDPSDPPEEPEQDPVRHSFDGAALHQFFDSQYAMTPLLEVPWKQVEGAIIKIAKQYRSAVQEGKPQGYIDGFFRHLDDLGELMKAHPDNQTPDEGIDRMMKRIKDRLISL
jgi:hypothetical protein